MKKIMCLMIACGLAVSLSSCWLVAAGAAGGVAGATIADDN